MLKESFSVLGCGRWGSFLSWYTSSRGFDTTLWGRSESKSYQALEQFKKNEYVSLNDSIRLTSNLAQAVENSNYIIISISAQGLRAFVKNLVLNFDLKKKTIILCMKGLEAETGKRLSEICLEEGIDKDKLAVWLGPGHIQDFTKGIPNCMTIDSYNKDLTVKLATMLNSELIRFYYGTDIIGNELGAACKNIMGIAAGILDGLELSTLKGALMARGAYEVSKLIKALGGDAMSAYGLTHLGDYETTLFSQYSNNRKFGELYAKNLTFDKLAEGVATTKAVITLAKKYNIDMPITQAIYNVLFDNKKIENELLTLFNRTQKPEKEF